MTLAALAMLTLGAASLFPPPLPAQTPPPLKEITRVVSSPLCTLLSEKGRPAIAGLMLNDGLTDYVGPIIVRYYNDRYAEHSTAADFDIVRMRDVAVRMAHNLEVVDAILASIPKPTGRAAATVAERQIEDLRERLNAVQNAQRGTINIVSGLAETEAMSDLESRANPLGSAVQSERSAIAGTGIAATAPEGWAGLAPDAVDAGDPRLLVRGIALGANVTTPYIDALSSERLNVRLREGAASDAILAIAGSCKAQPSPAPSARP